MRAGISKIMSSAGPGLRRQLLQADISPECSFGLFKFMRAIQTLEPWALRLVDATAKYPTGFLQASLAEIGAYDECIETVVHDDHGVEVVRGQFCNVHVLVGDDLSFVDNVIPAFRFSHKRAGSFKGYLADKKLTGLRMGVCFINSCTEQDITNIGRTLFGTAADIVVKNCVTGVDDGIDITQACIITVVDTINNYYLLPFYHGVCFFSGCITFLLVERFGKVKISKLIQASLWCISLFCGLYCIFMKIDWYRTTERASETRRLFVAFTDRILWSVCVAWFVFTCATGRGGFLNRFLCWSPFVPLSRLSFGVYLVHSPFYIMMYHIARERIFFSHFTLVSQCFAVVVWSYILSYFLFIACEGPTGHLEKLVFMPVRRSVDSPSDATKNGVHHNGVNGIPKSLPACTDEQNKSKKYLNEDSLEAGVGITGKDSNECCRL
ncbi:hypothetical protein HPB52_019434 [Rhipicephalus sanguineus]|uniref:Nose resistant-to-fluoxetine protein N-terminal domain-containing protein n=2 Tax=Rhipicephalus sanguineus TaxID=34632 RepID=A0A9D4YQR9_RHISA|nr:hypothetical protein HPB52_019434 [Rhipicephalus sanguineus]